MTKIHELILPSPQRTPVPAACGDKTQIQVESATGEHAAGAQTTADAFLESHLARAAEELVMGSLKP